MNDELAHLRKRLDEEGESMLAFFDGLSVAEWEQPVYADGSGWRVRHVLAHFVSAERTYLHYLRQTLAGGEGVPADFDIDRFNESQVPELSRRPIADLKAELRSARQDSVAMVAGLTPADLDRRGRHPWLGEADLRSVLKLLYRHPMIHLRDVRAALRSQTPMAHEAESGGGERLEPMNARTRAIRDDLVGAHTETWPILSGLSPDDLQVELYVDGETGWRVRDAVAHLADAQRGLLGQIRRLVVGEATVPEGFDLNRWNRGAVRRRAEKTFEELIEELRSGHDEALDFLPTLSDQALDRRGRHPSGEWLTAEGYFHRMANHRREHVADIARAIGRPNASR